jgi:signal transduction histidine kinase
MTGLSLHTQIFLRALGLLWSMILVVTLASGTSSVIHQREYARSIYQGQVRTLTLQMADDVLRDDRVALYKLMEEVVAKDEALGYVFLERNGEPYVYTFSEGVPKDLMGLGPFSAEQARLTQYQDQAGGRWFDIAQAVPADTAVLHLGVKDKVLFRQALSGLHTVLMVSAAALLGGTLFAWNIAVSTTREVHARQQIEQELHKANEQMAQHAAKLEAANKELEAFSYSVSHDLRSPLRAIDGFSHILQDEYADKLDDEGRRLLAIVRDNTQRMGQLIDDILQFSRTGRLEMSMSEVDMEGLAHAAIDDIRTDGDMGPLQVEIGHLPAARGDRAMLRQVFTNLLSNAVKFSHANPSPKVVVGGSIQDDEAVYFVRDNGVGFDMQYVDKLFGVFQRLHTTSEFEGTGIGLAIVKRIVTRHGGRVWAEGKLNEGATIYFTLPAIVAPRDRLISAD